jgi:hypothetical protein
MESSICDLVSPFYIVQDHDTIEGISIKTGIKVSALRRMNKIYGNDVFTGQKLVLHSNNKPTMEGPSSCETIDPIVEYNSAPTSLGDLASTIFGFGVSHNTTQITSPVVSTNNTQLLSTSDIATTTSSATVTVDSAGNRALTAAEIQFFSDHEYPVLEDGCSKILSPKMTILLQAYLPVLVQYEPWTLLYSLYDHGSDFTTFYNNVEAYQKSLIVVQTDSGDVFGGYASSEWKINHNYTGNGQSFLYKFGK